MRSNTFATKSDRDIIQIVPAWQRLDDLRLRIDGICVKWYMWIKWILNRKWIEIKKLFLDG
jgi:hypothetical protein